MLFLAAIRTAGTPAPAPASPAPGAPALSGGSSLPELRDIQPPVDFFPWPLWQVLLAGLLLTLLVGGLIWWLTRLWAQRTPPAPPSPKQVALEALHRLRACLRSTPAYEFSIAVSGTLRTFLEHHYRLRPLRQTTPEFLAAVAATHDFTREDRQHLQAFLEGCDEIKFARAEAGAEVNEALLERAFTLVQGGRS